MSAVRAVVVALCSGAAFAVVSCAGSPARSRLDDLVPRSKVRSVAMRPLLLGTTLVIVAVGGFGIRFSLVLGMAALLVWTGIARIRQRRAIDAIRASVVEMCRATAAELRAGQPAGRALVTAGQLLPESGRQVLAAAFAAAAQGVEGELADLLVVAASSPGLSGLSRLAACWRVAASTGVALATALDRIGDGLQDEIDVGRDISTMLAGPRATVRLLAALPAIGLALGTVIGADPLGFLLGRSIGRGCLIVASILEIAGLAWAARIAAAASVARLR